MNILILTFRDHMYANALLRTVMRIGACRGHLVDVREQNAIVPGKHRISGLLRYIKRASVRYVAAQTGKQGIFLLMRFLSSHLHALDGLFYPYWRPHRSNMLPGKYYSLPTKSAVRALYDNGYVIVTIGEMVRL